MNLVIEDLESNYQGEVDEIESSEDPKEVKAQNKLRLNYNLISKADEQRSKLEKQLKKEKDESKKAELEQQIAAIDNVIDTKTKENKDLQAIIDESTLAAVDTNENQDLVVEDKFTSPKANEANQKTLKFRNIISDINNDIFRKEEEYKSAETDKEKEKIKASIDKLKEKKTEQEIKLADEIEAANIAQFRDTEQETDAQRNEVENFTSNATSENPDYQLAQDKEENADQLLADAKQLRLQADGEKDDNKKRSILVQAIDKENQAIEQEKEAAAIYTTMADETYITGSYSDPSIGLELTEVDEDPEKRKSAELRKLSDEVLDLALAKSEEADKLRAEAKDDKKKVRNAKLEQAGTLDQEAEKIKDKSLRIEAQADAMEKAENDFLAEEEIKNAPQDVSETKTKEVLQLPAYKIFFGKMEMSNENRDNYNATKEEITKVKSETKDLESELSDLEEELKDLPEDEQQPTIDAIAEIKNEITATEYKLDSLNEVASNYKEEELKYRQEADDYLESINDTEAEDIYAVVGRRGQNLLTPIEAPVIAVIDPRNPNFEAPERIAAPIFAKTNEAVYSEENKIPIDAKPIEGLVYKVQVGAFSKPIPQDLFADFAPISGESIRNNITRYMVGYFGVFDQANGAKNEIRGFNGYEKSFVVAYLNGKRISIAEARAYERDNNIEAIAANITLPETNPRNPETDPRDPETNPRNPETNPRDPETDPRDPETNPRDPETDPRDLETNPRDPETDPRDPDPENIVDLGDGNKVTYEENAELAARYNATPNAAKALQGEGIKGLYYTVQVGAYSKPLQQGQLNIDPLVVFSINNLWKYTTGVYNNLDDARVRRTEAINQGVTDAFIIAYNNGQRITIARANELVATEGETVFTGNASTEVSVSSNQDKEVEGVQYFVHLGMYDENIPEDVSTVLLAVANKIKIEEDEDFNTNYKTYDRATYREALELYNNYKQKGISKAKIVATYKYANITLEEAARRRAGLNPEADTFKPEDNTKEAKEVEGLFFRVLLGSFAEDVPSNFTFVVLESQSKGYEILNGKDVDGNTIYITGNFTKFAEAEALKEYFKKEGIESARVFAELNEQYIDLNEAIKKTYE